MECETDGQDCPKLGDRSQLTRIFLGQCRTAGPHLGKRWLSRLVAMMSEITAHDYVGALCTPDWLDIVGVVETQQQRECIFSHNLSRERRRRPVCRTRR
jgi:hypothetical protein